MDIEIKEYLDHKGKSPFAKWFNKLDKTAAAKITTALYRIQAGNLSNVKRIGIIYEYKLVFGPGYRIYFGKDGEKLVILLGGGSKKMQSKDIENAKDNWQEYLRQKGDISCH